MLGAGAANSAVWRGRAERRPDLTTERSANPLRTEDIGAEAAKHSFEPPIRIHTSLLADHERRILDALCRRMPSWATPDLLTAIGSAGMAVAAIGYVASRWRPEFLFVASLGLAINWFGDSLDGSLARYRGVERPRYGYFLDHSVDAFNNLVFALGLGLSPYVSMEAALLLLCSYYLMTVYVLLSAQVNHEFSLTKGPVGPTELRLIAIVFNCAIFVFGPIGIPVAGSEISIYSALVAGEAVALILVFVNEVYATARKLGGPAVGEPPGG